MNTPENSGDWRALADQLTPEQITELAEVEEGYRYRARFPIPPGWTAPRTAADIAAVMMIHARARATENILHALAGDIPPPAGATPADAWYEDADGVARLAETAPRTIAGSVAVSASCAQHVDGSLTELRVRIDHVSDKTRDVAELTGEQARQLAQALIDAATTVDTWGDTGRVAARPGVTVTKTTPAGPQA